MRSSGALVFLLCLRLNAQQATFSGLVINAITKESLAGVHVTLLSVSRFPDPNQPYGSTSGRDGRFSIPNLPAGVYTLSPRHNGFLYLQDENRDFSEVRITLKPGDAVADRVVEMTPIAIISGRVVDEFGDPVERASVRARAIGVDSSMSPVLSRMYAFTDDRGQFRITGAPGKFRVAATSLAQGRGVHEIRSDGSEPPVYAETWHPASESQDRGAVVEAIAGREVAGIDIRLVRKRSLTISGVVTGTPEGSIRAEIFAHTKFLGLTPATPGAEGRFSFSGLPSGQYYVWAHYQSGSLELNSAPAEVLLENANETSLTLGLAPSEQLSGTVEFERDTANRAPAQTPTVRLELLPFHWVEIQGKVDREGKFSLRSVFPGKYRLRVESLPENAFIKAVSVDGNLSPDTVVDFTRGVKGSEIKISISLKGASIEGTVSSETGKAACCAMVVLADNIENVNDHMISVPAGEKYRFTGLHPGKYRLIVSGPARAYGTQAAEELFSESPEIELHEGEHVTRDVTFKPRGVQ
jgi:hypothetical protein